MRTPQPLPPEILQLAERAELAETPSTDQTRRMAAQIASLAVAGSTVGTSIAVSSLELSTKSWLARVVGAIGNWVSVTAVVVTGLVAFGDSPAHPEVARQLATRPAQPSPVPAHSLRGTSAPSTNSQTHASSPVEAEQAGAEEMAKETAEVAPASSAREATESSPKSTGTAVPGPKPRSAAPSAEQDPLQLELTQLRHMEQALRDGQPGRVQELAASITFSHLRHHATALRAIGLCASGQVDAGRRLWTAHYGQDGTSPFSERVGAACKLHVPTATTRNRP